MFARASARLSGALVMTLLLATSAAGQSAREGSGTSWLPDSSPMYALHVKRGAWMLMAHANAFLQFLYESGDRGGSEAGSINWLMGMAEREGGRGRIVLRGMASLEPWTIHGCGYPDLLASGEQCHGGTIPDRQHPHDAAMEISASYDAPLRGAARWQIYGGPAGEPALGPTAYPHRISAMPNPLAPIAHHWLDSTHVSFGVVTGGVYGARWKAESSVFNGREPDEHRTDFDFGALDSVSGRVWFLPTSKIALQVSAGHLTQAEAGVPGESGKAGPRRDVNKLTASATFQQTNSTRVAASTFAWGRNAESGHGTNAMLLETNVTFHDRDAWFGRLEVVEKTPDDLDVPPTRSTFTLSKIQGGYTRYVRATPGFKAGIGAAASAGIVPSDLSFVYGSRVNPGIAVFLTLRPSEMVMSPGAGGGVRGLGMVETADDPSRLTCPAGFDPGSAPSTAYQGKTYYFCSTADRDKFLTDPKMSLTMMPPRQ